MNNLLQKKQIDLGLAAGIDTTLYAKPEFDNLQMYEIRIGLEHGIDASQYSKPEYEDAQMCEIRKGLELGLDVSNILNSDLSRYEMRDKLYNT